MTNSTKQVKHTAGPWSICPNEPDGDTWHIIAKKGQYICGLDMYPNSDADAALIAAAPELLEACKEAYAYLQYNHGQGNKAFELCGKAISKSEGRA